LNCSLLRVGSAAWFCDDAEIRHAIDEVLHRERNEKEAHDADEDADAGFAETFGDAIGVAEDEIADDGGDEDGAKDGGHLPPDLHLSDEHHDAGDGAGAGEHGDAERNDAGVGLAGGFLRFFGGLLGGGALGLEHVETDEQKDDAAGDLKGGERDAEEPKEVLAGDREDGEDDPGGEGGFARDSFAPGAVCAGSDGEKGRKRGEGINKEEDGAERQERKAHIDGVPQAGEIYGMEIEAHLAILPCGCGRHPGSGMGADDEPAGIRRFTQVIALVDEGPLAAGELLGDEGVQIALGKGLAVVIEPLGAFHYVHLALVDDPLRRRGFELLDELFDGGAGGGVEEGLDVVMPRGCIAEVVGKWIGKGEELRVGDAGFRADIRADSLAEVEQISIDVHGSIDRVIEGLAALKHGSNHVVLPGVGGERFGGNGRRGKQGHERKEAGVEPNGRSSQGVEDGYKKKQKSEWGVVVGDGLGCCAGRVRGPLGEGEDDEDFAAVEVVSAKAGHGEAKENPCGESVEDRNQDEDHGRDEHTMHKELAL